MEFVPNGSVYISGQFHEKLNPGGHLAPNYHARRYVPPLEANNSDDDFDYFIVRYSSADKLGDDDTWANFSNLNAANTGSNSNSPTIQREEIRDMTATTNYVAITGSVSDPGNETGGKTSGFAHVLDFTEYPPASDAPLYYREPSGSSSGDEYQLTYENSQSPFYGRAVDNTSDNLVVGGTNLDTNYSLGGPTLPGGQDFIVSYQF